MTEIGRKKIKAHCQRTFGRSVGRWSPRDCEAVEGRFLEFDFWPSLDFTAANLTWVYEFDRLEAAASLVRLIRTATFFPELPTRSRALPLLFVLERDPDVGPVFEGRQWALAGVGVNQGDGVCLAFVEICDGDFVMLFDHGGWRVQCDVVTKVLAWLTSRGYCARQVVFVRLWGKADERRLHLDLRNDIFHRRVLVRLIERGMVECRRLMGELMRRKRLRVLWLESERVGVLEVVMICQCVRVEALELRIVGRGLASVEGAFRGGEGEGGAQAEAKTRRVQIAGLAVVERVGPARRGRVVAWRLVCEGGECKAVGVEQRGGESPWLVVAARGRVLVFDIVRVARSAVESCQ